MFHNSVREGIYQKESHKNSVTRNFFQAITCLYKELRKWREIKRWQELIYPCLVRSFSPSSSTVLSTCLCLPLGDSRLWCISCCCCCSSSTESSSKCFSPRCNTEVASLYVTTWGDLLKMLWQTYYYICLYK